MSIFNGPEISRSKRGKTTDVRVVGQEKQVTNGFMSKNV